MKFSLPSLESLALKTLDDEVRRVRESMGVETTRFPVSMGSQIHTFDSFAPPPGTQQRQEPIKEVEDLPMTPAPPAAESPKWIQKRPLAMMSLAFVTGVLIGWRSSVRNS